MVHDAISNIHQRLDANFNLVGVARYIDELKKVQLHKRVKQRQFRPANDLLYKAVKGGIYASGETRGKDR